MAAFSVTTTPIELGAVLRLIGSADMMAEAALEREINRLTAAHHKLVVVDLSELTFIASLAVGQLVMLQRVAKVRGGKVRVASPTEEVQKVLVRCHLTDVLPIFPSVQAAVDEPLA